MVGGGLPTRRRSNSTGAGGSDPNNHKNRGGSSSRVSTRNQLSAAPATKTRSKRRSSSFPTAQSPSTQTLADSQTGEDSIHPSDENVKDEEPDAKAERASSPQPNLAASSGSRSPRSPSESTSVNSSAVLVAVVAGWSNSKPTRNSKSCTSNTHTMQVTLKLGGKLFFPNDFPESSLSPPSFIERNVATRRRSRSMTKEEATPDPRSSRSASLPLGHDGNTFYCQICGGVGDVVCCDGCPHVFHRKCIPKSSKSRASLEHDDDPWYCPDCFPTKSAGAMKKAATPSSNKKRVSTRTKDISTEVEQTNKEEKEKEEQEKAQNVKTEEAVERTCFECNEKGFDLKQCQLCDGWIHFPSCHPGDDDYDEDEEEEEDDDDSPRKPKKVLDPNRILCRICCVEEMDTGSQDSVASTPSVKTRRKAGKVGKRKRDDNEDEHDNEEDGGEDDNYAGESKGEEDDEDDEDDTSKTTSIAKGRKEEDGDKMDVDDESTKPDESPISTPSDKKKSTTKVKSSKSADADTADASPKSTSDRKSPSSSSKRETRPSKKRNRSILPSSKVKENQEQENAASIPATPSKKKKSKDKDKDKEKGKKKKKKKKKEGDQSTTPSEIPAAQKEDDDASSLASSLAQASNTSGYPRATPAFFFFLGENRVKIERHLSRKHRIFNRLPKGYERNELIAKEGAIWWSKLKESEIRRFMAMSMSDFEQRIIEWKQEKNLRDMMLDETHKMDDDDHTDGSLDDEVLTYENHQRLYLGTTVGSKPFKPESGTSHNRVLLELLQDMRFHQMPMFQANRSEVEYGQMDFDRITIPYFDVHGPFSTSVGDECLGCTRGWNHYCNVLKRRIPAIEHRAKLQPPLSSLMTARVGLGLKPKSVDTTDEPESEESAKNLPLFAVRDVPDIVSARKLPQVTCEPLTDPSARADDIVQFIEETVSMKVPEPPRPDFPGRLNPDGTLKKKHSGARAPLPLPLPGTAGQKRGFDSTGGSEDRNSNINKCGRCRTVISTDTGCIQCRRAQLVINMSKRPPTGDAKQNGKSTKDKDVPNSSPAGSSAADLASGILPGSPTKNNLKVQTVMLGRIMMKDGSGDVQNEADVAIANGILRQRWTPFTILPPHTLDSPTPRSKRNHQHEESCPEEPEEATIDDVLTTEKQLAEPEELSEHADDASTSASRPKKQATEVDEEDAFTTEPSNGNSPVAAGTRPASKRIRSSRLAASEGTQMESLDDNDRQEFAIRYKEEADELHKKCLRVACRGVLLALMRRDPLLLFASPVTAEGYSSIIKTPIDFGKIRSSVLGDKYSSLGSFVSDCRLLCTNALAYNPPGSIYWKTAKELYDVLAIMQRRVSKWMNAVRDAHATAWRRVPRNTKVLAREGADDYQALPKAEEDVSVEDPFAELRKTWPEAVDMLGAGDWLRRCISVDFMRTKENETAYYGALAVRRTAAAAEAALADYPDSGGVYSPVAKRSHAEDEALRCSIHERVAEIIDPVELKDLPSWREESIIRVMRRAQSRRFDGMSGSSNGCARCDENLFDRETKRAKASHPPHWGPKKPRKHELARIHPSRVNLSTGMASKTTRDRIQNVMGELHQEEDLHLRAKAANQVAVSVKGSGIHGWGLFADQYFKKGDVVAEYIGEYVSLAVTEAREKEYQEQRIQDYQFRLDDQLVIDATMRGGHGRYINHNCSPNCIAKIIPGTAPNEHLKRVIIIAQRGIEPREELTYDYQFPLELDLEARIPCNCMSDQCRGFMNWDLPEKGSNQNFRSQKRGANMRDRIRRLGRPLKSEKGDDDKDDDGGTEIDDQSKN